MTGACFKYATKCHMKPCNGFSLIELVTVITLVGILSAYAVARWPSDSELKLPSQANLFQAHLKHTQYLASIWGVPLRLTIAANSYSVSCVTSPGPAPCDVSPVIDPATNEAFNVVLQSGVSLSLASTPAVTDFDSLGRPVSSGSIISTTPARTFSLVAGSSTRNIVLSSITGYVQ